MRRVGRIQSAERAKPTSITTGIQVTIFFQPAMRTQAIQ